jgi:hypothetical protein
MNEGSEGVFFKDDDEDRGNDSFIQFLLFKSLLFLLFK